MRVMLAVFLLSCGPSPWRYAVNEGSGCPSGVLVRDGETRWRCYFAPDGGVR